MEFDQPNEPEIRPQEKRISLIDKMRENPWIVSTFVLGLLCLTLFVSRFSGGLTGKVISENDAGEMLLDFYESNGAQGIVLDSVDEVSGLYKVNFEYQGAIVPIYVTKDGKFAGSLNAISSSSSDSETETTEVPQEERPEVGLYIWSYCPYGVTALEPFAEVASLLGDSADFKVYLYYAGHGDFEVQQNKIQACIQNLGSDKYLEYATGFATGIYKKCSGDAACDLDESTKLMNSLGIDSAKVLECVDSQGEALLDADLLLLKQLM